MTERLRGFITSETESRANATKRKTAGERVRPGTLARYSTIVISQYHPRVLTLTDVRQSRILADGGGIA